MEIKINIPKNDYVQATEVREKVVQAICNTFLENHCDTTFRPYSDGRGRHARLFRDCG